MKKVLLTGFKLFDKFEVNPSEIIVQSFVSTSTVALETMVLDVDFEKVSIPYHERLEQFQPDFILNMGLSATKGVVQLERNALNCGFDHIHDKEHFVIEKEGEQALYTRLDVDTLGEKLCEKGVPTLSSNYAGAYLCNYIYYYSLKWCQQHGGDALFMHIPFTSEIASRICLQEKKAYPSLSQSVIETAINEVIAFWLESKVVV